MSEGVGLNEFRQAFAGEAEELLAHANKQALALEGAVRLGTGQSFAVRELFRAVHTIKGLAAMVAVEPIVALAHAMEELLRGPDRTGALLSAAAVDAIIAGLDAITRRVQSVQAGEAVAEPPVDVLLALETTLKAPAVVPAAPAAETVFLLDDEVASRLNARDRQQLAQGVLEGKRALRIDFSPSPALALAGHTITSVRERIATVAELVKVVPLTDAAAPSGLSFVLLVTTKSDDAALAEAVKTPIAPPREIISMRAGSEALPAEMPQGDLARVDVVRVDVARLDVALDRVSDLVITRFRLQRAVMALRERGVEVRELLDLINRNARQLRDLRAAVLHVRMVPLEELFARMRLLVRGITRGTSKQVALSIDAGAAEVDKTVADHVFPAIVHLARNAVDHGIEPAHERERAGKRAEATLRISARQASSTQIEIRMEDDGRGIDAAAICKRANVPLVKTHAALLELLCRPGFSTLDEASTTSGRGMGMDIVHRAIVDQLGGELSLTTEPGKGTQFLLRLPLTIAIVDAFIFHCGGQRFVAPNASIEEVIEFTSVIRPLGNGTGLISHRGQAIPFVELAEVLRMRAVAQVDATPRTQSPQAFLVRRQGELLALGIDKVLTQQEIVVRPMHDKLIKVPGINGATDLGDGVPTLVLDLVRLASIREAA